MLEGRSRVAASYLRKRTYTLSTAALALGRKFRMADPGTRNGTKPKIANNIISIRIVYYRSRGRSEKNKQRDDLLQRT